MYKKSAKFIYILSDYIRCIVEKNSNLRELLLKEFFKNKKKRNYSFGSREKLRSSRSYLEKFKFTRSLIYS